MPVDTLGGRRKDTGMSELEVFWGSGSQPSWRVLLALELKQVPYTSRLLSFSAGEHKTPEFLALNPRHKVPTIRLGDFALYESIAILCYLEKKYPTPPLFGTTPEETGLIWRWVAEYENYLEPILHRKVVVPFFFNRSDSEADSIREAIPQLHDELARWEQELAGSPWLVGSQISAADIALFPNMMALRRAMQKPAAAQFDLHLEPLDERYPSLARWIRQVEALPGYEKTYPPHWRQ